MLAAATSFFGRTNISASYNIGGPSINVSSRSSTPGPSSSGTGSVTTTPLPVVTNAPTFNVGPWKVQAAAHKTTNKRVSVWSFDKRSQEMEKLSPSAKDRVLEVLKTEAQALGRMRHPCVLEMVEPLEETRNELVFATEPVISSLHLSIPGAYRSSLVDLDEIQKGILQLCKGLSFLHTSARLIHSNISPESILINNSGDWKIGGLGLTIPLTSPDGNATRWEFPTFDGRVPSYIQRSFDYMAPEYALDEVLSTDSDMYSLGCLIFAVHSKGSPPYKTHGSLSGLRDTAGSSRPIPGIERLDPDLQGLLASLITRRPPRPSPSSLPSHSFFSSLPISTLNFLDRSNFATKSREEKVSFMKGLTSVLDKFSEGLRVRKILPSLVEEMKDTHLLPYILPNVFAISSDLTPTQFATTVLPSLKPLFAIKEPPQNMLTLLDNLSLLQAKTDKAAFREHVLPLVYNALESEHAIVQERALKVVPDLCETIDYAEVQGVLFPRVALVFTKTRVLSVKVATLNTFLSMVKTLDQTSLTQKLVPLLSKIRTKEPAVMTATLSVQEAMGLKVDREAVATLVLPQLWAMSMGPLLSLPQFQRFMAVIRKLGDRVEKEHIQFLRDSQRTEDHSTASTSSNGTPVNGHAGALDFASLVSSAGNTPIKADGLVSSPGPSSNAPSWEDDVWGSIFSSGADTPQVQGSAILPPMQTQSTPSSPGPSGSGASLGARSIPARPHGKLGARPISSTSLSSSSITSPSVHAVSSPPIPRIQPLQPTNTGGFSQPLAPSKPNYNVTLATTPNFSVAPAPAPTPPSMPGPNYNIALQPSQPTGGMMSMGALPMVASPPPMSSPPLVASPPPMNMNSLLTPSKPASWGSGSVKKPSADDWGDFDPLK
ncbi:kinase-like protein [Punctularia strigosozonata HHB-11173 SS5]|uniref:kinase-like protein n=1 Tax=Punctularia strigosozonata (strain HHB-11173) TaxID=741275 RepID=UPI000441740E|nr:kinase-like protein [Punctularia strigosozonata HHB-11173 SS5]EIN07701.1 kinase-like protein [Punctularia strigosozonata HHB-11173 SS5]